MMFCISDDEPDTKATEVKRRPPVVAEIVDVTTSFSLSDDEMERTYARSRCLVATSTYEGYHMPAMEAYLRGIPIVVPREEPFPGIYGDAAGVHYFVRGSSGPASLPEAVRAAISAPPFSPDPGIAEWCSFRRVALLLRTTYESVLAR